MGCMRALEQKYSRGLEGVIAAISSISCIDGEEGHLIYRGYPIEVLAKYSNYEETAYLLLKGHLPNKKEYEDFVKVLKENQDLHPSMIDVIKKFMMDAHPMDVIRSMISLMGVFCPDKKEHTREAKFMKAIRVTAKLPTMIAAFHRLREGKDIVEPDTSLGYAENFLYMMNGEKPDELSAKVLDIALVLHAEHGMNASTFSAMVTASTLSDVYSAVAAAIGTLKGPLHGGANERVMDMLDEIENLDKVEEFLENALAEKRKIMGFGHRVYRAYDPRAKVLKDWAYKLCKMNDNLMHFEMGKKIEQLMIEKVGQKGIYPNVDFYSGLVYTNLGIPRDIFTPIFAMARSIGWTAHVLEYLEANRIYRPRAIYNGPIDIDYIPMDERE